MPGDDAGSALAAVLAGCAPAEAEDGLEELADLGLLLPAADGRYRFHDLVRLFATERLEDEDLPADRQAAADRMRHWLLDVALTAGRQGAAGWLRVEGENWLGALRLAAAAGDHARVVEVAEACTGSPTTGCPGGTGRRCSPCPSRPPATSATWPCRPRS